MDTLIETPHYPIFLSHTSYRELNNLIEKNIYSKIFIIVDSKTNEHCLPILLPHIETNLAIEIIEFENGEKNKNIETCVQIWEALTELKADRKSLIINLGGGVVTDLGGFIASTFKRGIDFVNIPTTLLSMVDASIGGKNGIDLGNLKNQIGVFNDPLLLLIDSTYLNTLPQNEMRSGLAEMIKHGLIFNKNYWIKFLNLSLLNTDDLDSLIHESIIIKNNIVTKDPKENGLRKILNFGHTIGHAIESYFLNHKDKTPLLHGEAIAIGMIIESFISFKKQYLKKEDYLEIKHHIKNIFGTIIFEKNDIDPILDLLIHDKKNEYGTIQFTLLNAIGSAIINQEVSTPEIINAFYDYNS